MCYHLRSFAVLVCYHFALLETCFSSAALRFPAGRGTYAPEQRPWNSTYLKAPESRFEKPFHGFLTDAFGKCHVVVCHEVT